MRNGAEKLQVGQQLVATLSAAGLTASSTASTRANTSALIASPSMESNGAKVWSRFSDLLIGATALSLGYSGLTANVPHFRQVPGLSVVLFR
jgi:predicted nucleic acid-binding protein